MQKHLFRVASPEKQWRFKTYWSSPESAQLHCARRGKDKSDCQNYIRVFHKINSTTYYVCGTNAFQPACDYMVIVDGQIQLLGRREEGKGKCPYDPAERYASVMAGGELYSATSFDFQGSEPVVLRSLGNGLRTEYTASWLNEPTFVHADIIEERENSLGGDDQIYVFFSEKAVEFDFYDKLIVPRIARVCKGDRGGMRTLQKKWTSFLKARLSCLEPSLNLEFNVVQDIFLLKTTDWRERIFYGIFTFQWETLDTSAVCAFNLSHVEDVFSSGSFKAPVTLEQSLLVKWVIYTGDVPFPRPGACIGNKEKEHGYTTSLDLPDKTLQMVKDHPLIDSAVKAIDNLPKLLKRGSKYTRIAVDRVVALDHRLHDVMFLGTDDGYIHKAVNYQGEMFIIQEVQLFMSPQRVESLQLSSLKGYLYVGSASQVVQVPVSDCGRYRNCLDCVLARDPYCIWARIQQECVNVSEGTADPQKYLQSIPDGDASECPTDENGNTESYIIIPGNTIQLKCTPLSNLANTKWLFNGSLLHLIDSKHLLYDNGILIFNFAVQDTGYYDCYSVERVNGKEFQSVLVSYVLYPQQSEVTKHLDTTPFQIVLTETNKDELTTAFHPTAVPMSPNIDVLNPEEASVCPPQTQTNPKIEVTLIILVAAFAALLASILLWNLYKRHLPCGCRSKINDLGHFQEMRQNTRTLHQDNHTMISNTVVPETLSRSSSNSNRNIDFQENGNIETSLTLLDLKFIDDDEYDA
ncbi:semaphorin-4E-like isoform X2 [Protopterus annectens]|uniref:semaphorin-4E-like isoform X2 n=1 Tax=Protopterus annectens TaxID=7888 RepID=UPI001CFB4024|nr:semaphorin-4E-like isoform X2 [Protopterus annectens]